MLSWLKKYNIMLKLLSVLAAVVLWFFVMSVINPEVTRTFRDVKVTIHGETELRDNRELSIVSEKDLVLDVTLGGSRNEILNLEKSDIELICDVSKVTGDGLNKITCTVELPSSDIVVKNQNDLKADIVFDKIIEKELTVVFVPTGSPGENLSLGTAVISPSVITVRGAATELAEIAQASVTAEVSAMTDTQALTLPVSLTGRDGKPKTLVYSSYLPDSVDITVPILLAKDIPLRVNFTAGGGLTENEVSYTINPVSVRLIGERSIIEGIEYLSLGMVDLDGIIAESDILKNIYLPSGTHSLSDSMATIHVQVKDQTTVEIELTDIELRGENNKYNVALPVGERISVRLRGNSKLLSSLTAEDISAHIDITSLQITAAGQLEAPVYVELGARVNAEIIGEKYTATVTVTRK